VASQHSISQQSQRYETWCRVTEAIYALDQDTDINVSQAKAWIQAMTKNMAWRF
jgi:hypothetical protein